MLTMINSKQVNGFKVGGNDVKGIAKNGQVIWEKTVESVGNIIQLDNSKSGGYAIAEIRGDYPENTTFELTRCGRNLFDKNALVSTNYLTDAYLEDGILYGVTIGRNYVAQFKILTPTGNLFLGNDEPPSTATIIRSKSGKSVVAWGSSTYNISKQASGIGVTFNANYTNSESGLQVTHNFNNVQLSIGTTAHSYEPYQGDTYTIPYNTPIKIPLLNGVNTFFADEDVDVTITHSKANVIPIVTNVTSELNSLGVEPAETIEEQEQQLLDMGVSL